MKRGHRLKYLQVFLFLSEKYHSNSMLLLFRQSKKTYKPSNVTVVQKTFSPVCMLLAKPAVMFFVLSENRETLFFIKIYCYPGILFQPPYSCFFETSILKEVPILHYLHNNSAITILKFQKSCLITHFLNVLD